MAAPETLQHRSEARADSVKMQIEAERHHSPLEVVAHLAVGRIGIRAVELHPGLLAAAAQALHAASGCEPIAAELGAQVLQQILTTAEASDQRQQLIHVARDTLGKPQARHADRLVVVDRAELSGA